MGVAVDSSKAAAFVREFASTPDASVETLPSVAREKGFDRLQRELLVDFWMYLEKTHGGRRAVEQNISRGFNVKEAFESHTTEKGRSLGDLFEAAEELGMAHGMKGLEQARETTMARNLTILSGELHDLLARLLEQANSPADRNYEAVLAKLEAMRADPPEDAPSPAKISLLAAWVRESKEGRAPTEKELQWFLLNGEAFEMVFSSSLRAAALWGGNEATGLMLENINDLATIMQEMGIGVGGKKRRGSLAVSPDEARAMEEHGEIPEHLRSSAGSALTEALGSMSSGPIPLDDLFGSLAQRRNVATFVDETRAGLEKVWKKSPSAEQVLNHLDAIGANESPDAIEMMPPWQAKMAARFMREDPDQRAKPGVFPKEAHVQEFLRDPEAVQEYLRPDSFCSNFATAFSAYTLQMTEAILSGIQALERSH